MSLLPQFDHSQRRFFQTLKSVSSLSSGSTFSLQESEAEYFTGVDYYTAMTTLSRTNHAFDHGGERDSGHVTTGSTVTSSSQEGPESPRDGHKGSPGDRPEEKPPKALNRQGHAAMEYGRQWSEPVVTSHPKSAPGTMHPRSQSYHDNRSHSYHNNDSLGSSMDTQLHQNDQRPDPIIRDYSAGDHRDNIRSMYGAASRTKSRKYIDKCGPVASSNDSARDTQSTEHADILQRSDSDKTLTQGDTSSMLNDDISGMTQCTVLASIEGLQKLSLTESWLLQEPVSTPAEQQTLQGAGNQNRNNKNADYELDIPECEEDADHVESGSEKESPKQKEFSVLDKRSWDLFRESTADTELYTFEKCYDLTRKVLKVLFMVLLFLLVLCCLVASKMCLLYVTSNMNPFVAFKKYSTAAYNSLANATYSRCGVPVCFEEAYKSWDTVRWVWCLYLCLSAPYVFTFLTHLWKILFKKKRSPALRTVLLVAMVESLHTLGLYLLLFLGLPQLDVTRALLVLCATGVVPSLLRTLTNKGLSWTTGLDMVSCLAQLSGIVAWTAYLALAPLEYQSGVSEDTVGISEMCWEINRTYHWQEEVHVVTTMVPTTYMASATGDLEVNFTQWWNGTDNITDATTKAMTTSPVFTTTQDPLPFYPIYLAEALPESVSNHWPIPVGLLLVSIVWWENFVDGNTKLGKLGEMLRNHKKNIHQARTKIYLFVIFWKGLLSFLLVLALYAPTGLPWSVGLETLFAWDSFIEQDPVASRIDLMEYDWIIVFAVQTSSGLLCYWFLKLSVRGLIQVPCVTLPIALATPVTFALLMWACHDCHGLWDLPTDGLQFWNCFAGHDDMWKLVTDRWACLGFVFWLAELWTTRHLWMLHAERLAKTDKIFVLPFYCGGLLEQSLSYNRRMNDRTFEKPEDKKLPQYSMDDLLKEGITTEPDVILKRSNDKVPMIYACATMWHENEAEMIQILKSIFRMDIDQSARSKAQQYFHVKDPDFYQFEAHVFFDDAFEAHADFDHEFQVNVFVKQFVTVIDQAAFSVHNVAINMRHPDKFPTPYGGRLEYQLPGGNHLVVHLKDKMKIRHRKRWSQVMYMYYFLGHRLMAQKEALSRKQVIADNMYILALDGDVDFKPKAVQLLIDLMRRDKSVAAACGRIHPVGAGPMVWYQKFEYSVSHWLAKCTEHVLGCVLCSPGCFSLFRGSALMDDNVMKTYSKRSSEASHHVQYDQGEDRWLCTLLLQQGYRIEYSAAADAMTYAPEGFNEFFNQRRRWTPSTFANILDLLTSARRTVRSNENISTLYMIYQGSLMASSILGPATIFLLIVGSFNVALAIPKFWAIIILLIPMLIFLVVCIYLKTETQLMVAALLSTLFAVVQVVVLVGILRQVVGDGLCHPNTQLLLFITAVFLFSGMLHPQEFFNLVHGFVYYLSIPAMYLVLILYSLCNLHVVSWGTREVIVTKAGKEQEEQKRMEAAAKKDRKEGDGGVMSFLKMSQTGGGATKKVDGAPITCGSLCHCLCCPRPGESAQEKQMSRMMAQMTQMQHQMDSVLKKDTQEDIEARQPVNNNVYIVQDQSDTESEDISKPLLNRDEEVRPPTEPTSPEAPVQHQPEFRHRSDTTHTQVTMDYDLDPPRDDLVNPYWLDDSDLGHGPRRELSSDERSFWQELIQKYLYPLVTDKVEQEKMAIQLKELRNKAVFAFILIDVLLIALIETLSMSIGTDEAISIRWNCTDPITSKRSEVELDPVALTFIIVFGIIIAIQFVCMFVHRLMTWLQIVASTPLTPSRFTKVIPNDNDLEPEQAIALVQDMQLLHGADDDDDQSTSNSQSQQHDNSWKEDAENPNRKTHLVEKLSKAQPIQRTLTMNKAFAKRFLALKAVADEHSTLAARSTHSHSQSLHSKKHRYKKRGQIPDFYGNRPRSRSLHDVTMSRIFHKRSEIFEASRAEAMRHRYQISDSDLLRHKRHMQDMVPVEEPPPDYAKNTLRKRSMHRSDIIELSQM